MADGQVLIDSKLDTGGVTKGTNKMEKEFDQLAKVTKRTAQIMEQELKSIEVGNVAEGLSDSFESEIEQVERAVDETADSVERSADQMADAMESSADDQADAMQRAWDKTEDEARSGSRKVRDDLDDIGDEAKETGKEIESSIGSAFSSLASKIGGLMATAFAAEEIFEFGKEAVELGSALAEVQNVVDVTFGQKGSQVINDFAKNAIKQFGLSELSAKQFSSTMGAMLKSMGDFDDTQIIEMSTALAGLAGDMASFYNIDAQEAFDKLRSGISGETEPLKQLGINLSVANLEAFALAQGITKSYDKMSESEKALLRYNYLLSATADAQGDFARTSDSWANQTRILTEEFNSLKGTLGQGLINVLNPLVTSINGSLMPVLQGLADKFVQLTETFDWNDLFGDVDFGPILSSLGEFGSKCSELSSIIGSGLKWAWDTVLVPLGTWTINAGLPGILNSLGSAFGAVASAIEWLSPLGEALWNNFLQPLASFTGDLLAATFQALAEEFTWIGDSISNLFENVLPSITDIGEKIKEIFPQIADFALTAFDNAGNYAVTGMIEPIDSGLDLIGAKSTETVSKVTSDMQNATAATGAAGLATVETTVAAMDAITVAEQESITTTSEAVVEGNKQLLDGVLENTAAANTTLATDATNTGNQIANSYTDAANVVTTTAFTPIEESGTATAEATSEAFDDAANTMKTAWADMGSWFDANVATPIKSGIESITSTMSSSLSSMQSETAAAWASIVDTVQRSVDQIQDEINSITGKTVTIQVVKSGVSSASANYDGQSYTPTTYNITPQIPYLATGAVIPPRAPFFAMLGDQMNGRNLEAPEELLRKIVREESGSTIEVETKVTFMGTLAQFVRMLFPEIKSEARRRGTSLAKEVME